MRDLSIAIVTYNDGELLEKCLKSIYENTHKISFEVFVVDNASTDGTVQIVKEKFEKVKLIINKENLGFVKATNQVLKKVESRYALLLNSDTQVLNNAFDKMVAFMDNHPKVGALGCKLLNPDGTFQKIGRKFLNFEFKNPNTVHKVSWICGACLMVRDRILKEVGLLDENLYFYNDDLDWCRRIKKQGWQLYYFPEAEVIHYGGHASQPIKDKLLLAGYKGSYYYCQKHYGKFIAIVYKGFSIMELLIRLAIYTVRREKENIRIYWSVFKGYVGKINR